MEYGFKCTHCPFCEMDESIPILHNYCTDEIMLCKSCTEDAVLKMLS